MRRTAPVAFGQLSPEAAKRVACSSRPGALPQLLEQAIIAGRLDLVELLLRDLGMSPDPPLAGGNSALHLAVEYYQPEIIELLCACGADANTKKPGGWTPLHLAVDIEADSAHQEGRAPSTRLIRLLLEAGADPTIEDEQGMTAGDLAVEWQHAGASELLRHRGKEAQ